MYYLILYIWYNELKDPYLILYLLKNFQNQDALPQLNQSSQYQKEGSLILIYFKFLAAILCVNNYLSFDTLYVHISENIRG